MSLLSKLGRSAVLGLAGILGGCGEEVQPRSHTQLGSEESYQIPLGDLGLSDQEYNSMLNQGFTNNVWTEYAERFLPNGGDTWTSRDVARAVFEMFNKGVSPARVKEYRSDFYWRSVRSLVVGEVPPEVANPYDARFDGGHIVHLQKISVGAENAHAYPSDLDGNEVVRLAENHVTSIGFKKYDSLRMLVSDWAGRWDRVDDIISVHATGIDFPTVQEYVERGFGPWSVRALFNAGVSPEGTEPYLKLKEKYGVQIDGVEIATFAKLGVSLEELEKAARARFIEQALNSKNN